MTDPILSVSALSRRHGSTPVLDEVDLVVAPGEFVILIGGSGSGKTTLLRTVGGLERADAGRVLLRGISVDDPAARRFVPPERRGLGMVFQDYALWPHMTVHENVAASLRGRSRDSEHFARELLEELGVGALADRRPAQLSGGQQQRVGLARALATEPDLLLLDEPLSSLDVDVRERMRTRIKELVGRRGAAALFVTHDPVDAWRLADRVAVLEDGRIVQAVSPEELYRRPATPRIARFTGAVGALEVPCLRNGGADYGFDWGDGVQPGIAMASLTADAPARAYIRPPGVHSGTRGEPAELAALAFEAGAWRATWRLPRNGWALCSMEAAPPPPRTRLSLSRDHIFLYSTKD